MTAAAQLLPVSNRAPETPDKLGCPLTPRETEVVAMLVETGCNKLIAHKLGMSPRTVEIHLGVIREKTGMTRHQLVCRIGYEAGLRDAMAIRRAS